MLEGAIEGHRQAIAKAQDGLARAERDLQEFTQIADRWWPLAANESDT